MAAARRRWCLSLCFVVVAVGGCSGDKPSAVPSGGPHDAAEAALRRDGCTTDTRADPGRNHVSDPNYRVNPPAGGDHNPRPADAGVYEEATAPLDGNLVHALEHGFVVLWYRPAAPGAADR